MMLAIPIGLFVSLMIPVLFFFELHDFGSDLL